MRARAAALALALALPGCAPAPASVPRQPVAFPHDVHLAYFASGQHRREKIGMHLEIFGDTTVPPELAEGRCVACHDDLASRKPCSECHVLFQDATLRARPEARRCIACHRGAWATASATLPGAPVCVACHGEERPFGRAGTVMAAAVVRGARAGDPPPEELPWVRVGGVPPNVYFTHRPHVQYARLACDRCHDRMAAFGAPPTEVRALSMSECLRCHQESGASTDCLTCHK